ncbi:hypothetical protein G3A43_44450 [Paraburkholderia aspalathi]|uniref:hypothetical protein n=1 Tax=Paraburkholderia nemoris TaxID=2793076 RepID=UPI00190B43FD|nr:MULTISPECIES: hypothetical protein [Paraburkholderia]MBK3787199.1 hypothetical protein [Paraburkholderia aspalathi]
MLGKLIKRFEPVPAHYAKKANARLERLADFFRRIGLPGDEDQSQFMADFSANGHEKRTKG